MRLLRWFAVATLVGIVPLAGRAQSPAAPVFHAIGDLSGGTTSSNVRDATRVGTMIYAVGASVQNPQTLCSVSNVPGCVPSFGLDTPILWAFDTTTSAASLTALPAIVNNTTATNGVPAVAISADGNYIASNARVSATTGQATGVRVTRALVPFPSSNLDLRPAPFNGAGVSAISADGSVLWGSKGTRALRYDTVNAAGNVTIPLLRPTDNFNGIPTCNCTSADGTVGAGISIHSDPVTNPASRGQAFRYTWNPATNTGALTGVPFSPNGGTWNRPMDLSANGQFTLLTGDSVATPSGELMIHNAADNSLTELGSPMSAWNASLFAGMTDDASVVATSFQATAGGAILGAGYIHNAHGWFQLNGILRRAGIDLRAQGWDVAQGMNINGISGDGTLLFGMMRRNGNFQGFVLEFPAGYLANYHPTPTPVADTSIVGAWTAPDNPGAGAIIFMKDGTYVQIATNIPSNPTGTNGFERGFYTWDSATGHIEIDTIVDTNGDEGLSESNDRNNVTVSVVGDTLTATVSPTNIETFVRLPTDLTTFVGTWVAGDPRLDDQTRVFVFLGDGTYFMADDEDPAVNGLGGRDGIESGTYSIDPLTGIVTATPLIDTNGDWGLSHPIGVSRGVLGPDGLTAMGGDDSGSAPLARVIDPNAVRPVVSSQAPFTLTLGQPFSSLVTATFRPTSFAATGLPAGLTIDGATGMISGAATALGSFDATISAANSLATGSGAAHFDVRPITCGPGSHLANPTDLTCTPDNRAPVCSAARATTPSIWPVNHQWVAEGILGVTDADGTDVRITITGIFQDEAVNEEGSGDTRIDGKGVGTATAFVRAEREGDDNGRVYHIRFVASDGQANCTGEVTVSVPHDRAHAAVDDGPRYDSTVPTPAHRGGDNCDHERGRNGHRKGDGCEHDRGRR